jgi:hypothetical protein
VVAEAHKAQEIITHHSKALMVLPITALVDQQELDIQGVGMMLVQVVLMAMEEGLVSMAVPEVVDIIVMVQTQVQEVIMPELQGMATLMEALEEFTGFFLEVLLQISQVDLEVEQVPDYIQVMKQMPVVEVAILVVAEAIHALALVAEVEIISQAHTYHQI